MSAMLRMLLTLGLVVVLAALTSLSVAVVGLDGAAAGAVYVVGCVVAVGAGLWLYPPGTEPHRGAGSRSARLHRR